MDELSVIYAAVLNPKSDKRCDYFPRGAVVFHKGKILAVGERSEVDRRYKLRYAKILHRESYLLLPSFFDIHFHWVQDDVRNMPKRSLLEWLKNYTWPYEAKFADKKYSAKKAEQFFTKLASTGTLGGMIYSSLHGHALVHALGKAKGDFVAGNVLMTMHSPLFLSQTKRNAVSLMKRFSRRYRNRYAVTPRFAITAHPEVMKEGGRLARKNGSFIQTHLSETLREIEVVLAIFRQIKGFEKVKNYTDVYGKCGLLGPKTVMGHGIFLSRDEMKKLARTRTAIAHCPTSNAPVSEKGLGSGLFDFRAFERVGGKWALASDIGGGPYLSMFDVMRSFVEQNRKIKNHHATFVKALYRATLAGADVMKLGKTNGNLETKKWANFILVKAPAGFDKLNCEEILINVISPLRYKRFLYDRLLREIWFQGERISK